MFSLLIGQVILTEALLSMNYFYYLITGITLTGAITPKSAAPRAYAPRMDWLALTVCCGTGD